MTTPSFHGVLQLLDWSESKRGRKVVFEVLDDPENPSEVHPFREFTTKAKGVAGQMFAAALVHFDPATDKAVDTAEADRIRALPPHVETQPKRDMKNSNLAGMLCRDPDFWCYADRPNGFRVTDEATAREWMLKAHGVKSRADFDSPKYSDGFDQMVIEFNTFRHKPLKIGERW